MSATEQLTFAQALNEAKQYIVEQSNRIKSDADKIKSQQQAIVDQCATITDGERKAREQAAQLAQIESEGESLKERLTQETSARQQAEGVCDRQGERITALQQTVAELEKTVAEQSAAISTLTRERDEFRAEVPTTEDTAALADLESLLTNCVGPSGSQQSDDDSQLAAA